MAGGVGCGEGGVEQVQVLVGEGEKKRSFASEDVLDAPGATLGVYEAVLLVGERKWREGGRVGERVEESEARSKK